MKKCVIITTINEPTKTIYAHIANTAYDCIIVGDKKTPDTYKDLKCIYLDVTKQKEMYPELADIIPYNHYCRKNLGYIYAIQNNYELIYETDDDNIPYENFDNIINEPATHLIEETSRKWINIFKYFTNGGHIWPRGYPLSLVKSESNFRIEETTKKPSIICGLVENDPDVDSIFRLTSNEQVKWEKDKKIFIANKNYSPFNTQNTFWLNKEIFMAMLIPSTVSFRYCDILRGIIASRLLEETDNNIMFTSPNVRQDRNEHNLMNDFKSEVDMFLHNETILNGFDDVSFVYLIQAKGSLPSIYECLRSRDFILLSYKEQTQDSHIYFPNSTWTTGRNKLREYALNLKKKYDYYIFLDEDVVFLEKNQEDGFTEVERLIRKYLPIIATPNYVGYYEAHAQKRVEQITEATTTIEVDALFNITRTDDEVQLDDLLESYDIALPELIRNVVKMDTNFSNTRILVWLQEHGWIRWDEGQESRRIKRSINGKQCPPKSRNWYVRKGSKFHGSSPAEMCLEVERVESEFIKKHKF
ncbi:hypothetical protein EBU71_13675 [bacterium]|nr:hypothetical protein [Candidatus Elulimicrobium humile]